MIPVLPCFYPTTLVLIDDDADTLEGLVDVLELQTKPHRTFVDPREGLKYIQKDDYYKTFSKDMMHDGDNDEMDDVLSYRPKVLIDELTHPNRYNQISVVIIDYEMPGINGLEICKAIDNPYIKKIMLTGIADESIAVSAFNQGLIYQYVRKQDPDFIELLQQMVLKAQQAYFHEICNVIVKILTHKFLNTAIIEPNFKIYFDDLIQKHGIVEYYLAEEIGSFLMVDRNQKIHSLITMDQPLVETLCENVLNERDLPHKKIDAVMKHKLIPFAYDPFNHPYFQISDLSKYLQAPTVIEGDSSTFYCAYGAGYIWYDPKIAVFYEPLSDS